MYSMGMTIRKDFARLPVSFAGAGSKSLIIAPWGQII
jgi:hypothetical protein